MPNPAMNPVLINSYDSSLIDNLLINVKHNRNYWHTNQKIKHLDQEHYFDRPLIRVAENKYAVIGKLLGRGAQGMVYDVEAIITRDDEGLWHSEEVNYVLKQSSDTESLCHEYEMTAQAGHLEVGQVVEVSSHKGRGAWMLMEKAPGIPLTEIIGRNISLELRLIISHKLIEALNNQVFSSNLEHSDISDDNILVQLEPEVKITIIDYGTACRLGKPMPSAGFKYPFLDPERLIEKKRDGEEQQKSDIHSLGRVLALLWGYPKKLHETNHCFNEKILPFILFDQINTPLNIKTSIRGLIEGMCERNPEQRLNIEQCLTSMVYINTNYLMAQKQEGTLSSEMNAIAISERSHSFKQLVSKFGGDADKPKLPQAPEQESARRSFHIDINAVQNSTTTIQTFFSPRTSNKIDIIDKLISFRSLISHLVAHCNPSNAQHISSYKATVKKQIKKLHKKQEKLNKKSSVGTNEEQLPRRQEAHKIANETFYLHHYFTLLDNYQDALEVLFPKSRGGSPIFIGNTMKAFNHSCSSIINTFIESPVLNNIGDKIDALAYRFSDSIEKQKATDEEVLLTFLGENENYSNQQLIKVLKVLLSDYMPLLNAVETSTSDTDKEKKHRSLI